MFATTSPAIAAAQKAEAEALHQQAEQNRRAAIKVQKNDEREQAAYQRAIAEQKAFLMRSPSSAIGKQAYPLQEALPLAQGPNTAAAGIAQDRPAGSSNDPVPPAITTAAANNPSLTLGTPYVSPRIAAHTQPRIPYGIRPLAYGPPSAPPARTSTSLSGKLLPCKNAEFATSIRQPGDAQGSGS